MAQANATATGDFSGFLNPTMAQNYFQAARKRSSVMQLARQIPLGINGVEIPYSTSKATASWVSEGGLKPTTESGLALQTITPHKIAAISVVSAEVVRANPGNYMNILRDDIAEAFAVAFDRAVFHGVSTPFDSYLAQTTRSVEIGTAAASAGSVYADIVSGLQDLVNDGKKLTGFAFDARIEPLFLGAVDTAGHPLWIDAPPVTDTVAQVRGGRLIGREAFIGDNITDGGPGAIVGFGGDWNQCVWGAVGGISYKVSTEAAVTIGGTLTSLFEHNLVAILAEAEYGFLCNDTSSFVKYLNAAGS
jgi:HK97 family phage major capsid protein